MYKLINFWLGLLRDEAVLAKVLQIAIVKIKIPPDHDNKSINKQIDQLAIKIADLNGFKSDAYDIEVKYDWRIESKDKINNTLGYEFTKCKVESFFVHQKP